MHVPKSHLVLHVGKLVDGVSKTARADMDIVIDGNRITAVETHKAGRQSTELPGLTAMPGFRVAAMIMASSYLLGIIALIWAPETVNQPLLEDEKGLAH